MLHNMHTRINQFQYVLGMAMTAIAFSAMLCALFMFA